MCWIKVPRCTMLVKCSCVVEGATEKA
jgi:hypothetical protein